MIDIPKEEEINSIISSNQSIKFYIASIFENHENWMYAFPLENNLTAVQAYFMDSAKEQPSLIIYKLQ